MDLVLNQFDNLVGDGFYSACNGALAAGLAKGSELLGEDLGKTLLNEVSIGWMLERESIPRQLASLFVLTCTCPAAPLPLLPPFPVFPAHDRRVQT